MDLVKRTQVQCIEISDRWREKLQEFDFKSKGKGKFSLIDKVDKNGRQSIIIRRQVKPPKE